PSPTPTSTWWSPSPDCTASPTRGGPSPRWRGCCGRAGCSRAAPCSTTPARSTSRSAGWAAWPACSVPGAPVPSSRRGSTRTASTPPWNGRARWATSAACAGAEGSAVLVGLGGRLLAGLREPVLVCGTGRVLARLRRGLVGALAAQPLAVEVAQELLVVVRRDRARARAGPEQLL